jgi:hypothetical protein
MKIQWMAIKDNHFVSKCSNYQQALKVAQENKCWLAKDYYGRIIRVKNFNQ